MALQKIFVSGLLYLELYLIYLSGLTSDTDSNDWKHRNLILYGGDYKGQKYSANLELYVEIMAQAVEKASHQLFKCWFMIEQVNGLRRMLTIPDVEKAEGILQVARDLIDGLLDTPRRTRLFVLLYYHAAETYRLSGKFNKAAESHEMSTKLAANDFDKLHAPYMAAYEWLNHALVTGKNIETCYATFLEEEKIFNTFLDTAGDDLNTIRWQRNVLSHHILYNFLVNDKLPTSKQTILFDNLPPELEGTFANFKTMAEAMTMFKSDLPGATNLLDGITKWDSLRFQITVLLVKADAEKRQNLVDAQKSTLEEIIELSLNDTNIRLDTHLPHAIAQRQLAELAD